MKKVNLRCKIEHLLYIKYCQRNTLVNTTISDAIEMQINTDQFDREGINKLKRNRLVE